jgi:hypothetical protein
VSARTALIALLVSLASVSAAFAGNENVASRYGAFAFADSSGTRVLALAPLEHPERVHSLIVKPGHRFRVTYEATQGDSPRDTGRQTYWNFRNTAGQRFRIEGGTISPDDFGFLAMDSLASTGTMVRLQRDLRTCEMSADFADIDPVLEKKLERRILRCWNLATYEDWGRIRLYEFAPKGKSYLASIILQEIGDTLIREDIPADAEDSTEVWRVGDGGRISPEAFDILFVLHGDRETFLATSWDGEEGQDLDLFRSSADGLTFELIASAYRYWLAR